MATKKKAAAVDVSGKGQWVATFSHTEMAESFPGILKGRRPLRDAIRNRVVDRVLAKAKPGTDRAAVVRSVDAVLDDEEAKFGLGDGKFLDWLINGGLEKIIELVLKLLPLFL